MTRILLDGFVFSADAGGGIARYFVQLLQWFRDNDTGTRLSVMVPWGVAHDTIKALPAAVAPRPMYARPATWRLLSPSLVHATYYTGRSVPGRPHVVTVYDFTDARFPAFMTNGPRFLDRQTAAIRNADAVVAISESTKADVVRFTGMPAERVVVAYPGIAPVFTQSESVPAAQEVEGFREKIARGAPIFLHVGERGGYKNFTTLLEGFCRLPRSLDAHLLLCGGEKRLSPTEERLLIENAASDRVHPMGRMDDATLRLAYAAAAATVHASLWEGFGLPVAEALACGGRVIISDLPVYREVAEKDAVYVEPYDVAGWTDALRAACESPADTPDTARSRVIETFSVERCGRKHDALYRELLSR